MKTLICITIASACAVGIYFILNSLNQPEPPHEYVYDILLRDVNAGMYDVTPLNFNSVKFMDSVEWSQDTNGVWTKIDSNQFMILGRAPAYEPIFW